MVYRSSNCITGRSNKCYGNSSNNPTAVCYTIGAALSRGQGPDREYFRLCRPDGLCHDYSTLLLYPEISHRQLSQIDVAVFQ